MISEEHSWIADGWGFGFGVAIGYALASVGVQIEWMPARAFLVIGGGVFGTFILIAFVAHLVSHGVTKLMQVYEASARIETQYAKVDPVAPDAPRVPFPPYRFVQFIWDWHEESGKFPTVRECGGKGFTNSLVQEWFTQMVGAGALVNRIEGQHPGDPAWSRERCEQAAIADNTLQAVPLPRVA